MNGSEIGTAIGGSVAIVASLWFLVRFLVGRIDKKQDKAMCKTISNNIKEDLHRGEEKFDKIMETQTTILVSLGSLITEVKHFNNKQTGGKDHENCSFNGNRKDGLQANPKGPTEEGHR